VKRDLIEHLMSPRIDKEKKTVSINIKLAKRIDDDEDQGKQASESSENERPPAR